MAYRLIPSRTREDLIEEVNTLIKLAEVGGTDKAAEYLRRLLQDEYDVGWTSGSDERQSIRHRTRMSREAI